MTTEILKVEKKIKADASRLFRAWLKEDEFSQWFLSGDATTDVVKIDPRVGGKYLILMHLDGREVPHSGEYKIIDEPNKIVFTWKSPFTEEKETLVTVTFTALPETFIEKNGQRILKPTTLVTLIHEMLPSPESIRNHTFGWTNIMNGLEAFHGNKE